MAIFPDDPVEAMETAKAIIGGQVHADSAELIAIAQDRSQPKWSRIAAIYTLGFTGARNGTAPLRGILGDTQNDAELRSYAAEALGNLHDRNATMLLKDILGHGPQPELRQSCEYALEEIG